MSTCDRRSTGIEPLPFAIRVRTSRKTMTSFALPVRSEEQEEENTNPFSSLFWVPGVIPPPPLFFVRLFLFKTQHSLHIIEHMWQYVATTGPSPDICTRHATPFHLQGKAVPERMHRPCDPEEEEEPLPSNADHLSVTLRML